MKRCKCRSWLDKGRYMSHMRETRAEYVLFGNMCYDEFYPYGFSAL